jgi:uncharacterized repeat protein (TIGR03803 family)
MLTPHRLRRLVATLSLALVCIATQAPAFARTQDANLIRLNAAATADAPAAVRGEMLLANDGNIYFMSSVGPTGGGIGRLAPDGAITTLHAFASRDEGALPYAGVMQASNGDLYGTTYLGGADGAGTIFRVSLTGTYTVLRSLGNAKTDAALPYTGLVQASDGNLYGTTLRGGNNDKGTIFRINLTGSEFAIIHHFNGSDGENPEGTLIVGADGDLYGTTLQGGSSNRGTIYRINIGGTLTSLYSFPSLSAFSGGVAINATGANPRARLLLAADGNYYGTAYQGGPTGWGTVFRMTPAGVVSVVHSFAGPGKGGVYPLAGVVQGADGSLYGTTYGNSDTGGFDLGSAWRIDSAGQFSLLHGFMNLGPDGANPYAGLVLANNNIYGVGYVGGLFKLDLGSNGVLPIEISVSPTEIPYDITGGHPATITWSAPGAATCSKLGVWTNGDTTTTGTLTVAPTVPGIYTYALSCTDGAGVARLAYTALSVTAPLLESVDGGGGTGALSIPLLLLLAGLLLSKHSREIFRA